MKKIIYIHLVFVLGSIVYSQDYAVDKYSQNISLMGGFSSLGGDLYEDPKGNRQNLLSVSTDYNVFIIKNLFIGFGFDYATYEINNINSIAISVGPQVGFALGDSTNTLFPFFVSSLQFNILDKDRSVPSYSSDNNIKIGGGVIIPLQKYYALIVEIDFFADQIYADNKANTFLVTFGISGLLF